MAEKFRNRYRIPSARLQNWDYRWPGGYFVTICTKNRAPYFGDVQDGTMVLSPIGELAHRFWYETKNHAPNVDLGEFVLMPNHVHGIIIHRDTDAFVGPVDPYFVQSNDLDFDVDGSSHHDGVRPRGTSIATSRRPSSPNDEIPIGRQRVGHPGSGSLSTIIGGYKSAVTREARRLGLEFAWQTRFHDRLIRDAEAFDRITWYIRTNPLKWETHTFHDNH